MKKWIIVLVLFLGLSAYWFWSEEDSRPLSERPCVFCDPAILKRQVFYEDDLVVALYTHRPIFPCHCLVIPKRHVTRFDELTEAEITQIGRVIKKLHPVAMKVFQTSPYLILQKNGLEVGQSVPHVHVHYIGRKEGDFSGWKFLFNMYIVNKLPPLTAAEMDPIIAQLREAMTH